MDLIMLLKAFVLGIVEGLTEFIPVSSTGHLIIVGDLIGFTGDTAAAFDIVIQLGAILGVVWEYRAKVSGVILHLHRKPERHFAITLLIAFLPAAIIGLMFHHYITRYLFNPVTVAVALVIGGFLILWIERLPLKVRVTSIDDVSYLDALKIGLAQVLSLFPGVSRAGATIMGGLVTGLSRTAATEFSFFLAMPVMFAASGYELLRNYQALHADDLAALAVGFVVSFITALIVVRVFLKYVSHHDFTVFAWYRIVFGVLVLLYFW